MSVYKEGFYAIDEIKEKSKQIYPDACDFGAPVNEGDPLWNAVKQAVQWYAVKGTREEYDNGNQVNVTISLQDEWNAPYKTHYFRISYFKTKKTGFDGFFEVSEIKRNSEIKELKEIENEMMTNN